MTFFMTCLFTVLYFIRPFELSEGLRDVPVLLAVGVVAGCVLLHDVSSGRVRLFRNGTDQMMLGLFIALGMSHLSHLYFGGARLAMQEFFPTVIGYLLVAHSIDSQRKLMLFLYLIVLCASFLAFEGAMEAKHGVSSLGVKPMSQLYGEGEDGEALTLSRIKWVGPFEDPNDLSMVFVVAIPFLVDQLWKGRLLGTLPLLGLIVYGLFLTNSRGGMLALLAAVMAYFVLRYRSFRGMVAGCAMAALLMVVGPSRMGEVSASESSAYGRLEAWYSGYQMFKQAPLFGVGKGMFTEFHELTAHNSFVLAFSELGLFGAFFFTGLFYYPVKSGYFSNFSKAAPTAAAPDLLNLYNAVWSSLVGLMVTIFFLSRVYMLLPYMMIALSMSFLNMANHAELGFHSAADERKGDGYKKILMITLLGLLFVNVMIKVLL